MNIKKSNKKIYLDILTKLLIVLVMFSTITLEKIAAETVPSFPAPTTVDLNKSSSKLSPLESGISTEKLNDPQALNAIRTLIQGGIPVGQSKTQIMNDVTPISQYSGSSTSKTNSGLNSAYRYVVKKGDTLNNIIKNTFNQHPIKMESIRKVIIATNRKAFPTGKPSSMQAGATLIIPSVGTISGGKNEGKQASMIEKVNPYVSTDPHRGWVRFP